MSVNRTLLHIGMPRTASTFFQNEVFPNLKRFKHIGVDQTQYSEAFQRMLYQDESRYDENAIGESLKISEGENLIISNELFVGQSVHMVSTNRTRNAKRLNQLFPNADVVLFLRNQADLLESLYSIGVYSGHTAKPHEFIRFDNEPSDSMNHFVPDLHLRRAYRAVLLLFTFEVIPGPFCQSSRISLRRFHRESYDIYRAVLHQARFGINDLN